MTIADKINKITGLVEVENFSRQEALDSFKSLGIPKAKEENWKYTNVSSLEKFDLTQVECNIEDIQKAVSSLSVCEQKIVFYNGSFVKELSSIKDVEGVSLEFINGENSETKNADIGSVLEYSSEVFVALNSASFRDAISIKVKENIEVSETIQIINLVGGDNGSIIACPRVFVETQKSASIKIVETYASFGSATTLHCPVSEYKLAENSKIEVCKVIKEGENSHHIANQQAETKRDAKFYNSTFNITGSLVRNNVNGVLGGENSFISLLGLSVLNNLEHVDNHTVLDHAVPNCDSYEVYKGVYGGKSKGIFDGTIIVRKDAQKTNAIQSNQGLLLSDDAASYAKPQLKIWADDVKCTHGATCGALDEEAMFYLLSRGISKKEAKNMLITAFAGEIIESLSDESVRSWVSEEIANKLNSIN